MFWVPGKAPAMIGQAVGLVWMILMITCGASSITPRFISWRYVVYHKPFNQGTPSILSFFLASFFLFFFPPPLSFLSALGPEVICHFGRGF